ncbi:carboxypeptidase-like regulatory domain-containing protein [Daejeonella sp.]|uniref:carboxypeptidase-like regulatory domain-containing protein n=1 Tax=Daejeonella sp. TaxID=2805397 RepID=UPI0025C6294C|nr:carboxypeptidase-like regulatory domain-containing protein [Daejeonella sp.]
MKRRVYVFMMKFILFFLILCSINVFAQENTLVKGKIINLETKEPIPYCSIVYLKKDKGVFSDSLGNFILKKDPLLDSIQITSLGYEKKLLSIQILEANNLVISLKPIYFKLNEVAITPDDNKIKQKKNKKKLGPIATKLNSPKGIGPGVLGRISAIYVANQTQNIPKKITEVHYDLRNRKNSIVRVQLYHRNELTNLPDKALILEDLIVKLKPGQNRLNVNIEKYNLMMPNNGLFVSLQWLGELDAKGRHTNTYLNISPDYTFNVDDHNILNYVSFLNKNWIADNFFYEKKYWIPRFGISVIEYSK